ncbi:MAG: formyltransferase family protein [Dehalococcoidia bacterium]
MTISIGWFSTGQDEAARHLLTAAMEAIQRGELDARIAFVFCNRERGEHELTDVFLDLVESYGIPLGTLSSRSFRRARGGALSKPGEPLPAWRREYDSRVAELVSGYPFDIGVLAGYMLIFTEEMCERYPLLNLHPAEPGGPAGTWQEVIWELMERRAQRSGAMLHLATRHLDEGPPVTYCLFSLRGPAFDPLWQEIGDRPIEQVRETEGEENRLFKETRRHGAARELPLVVATLRAFADGRVRIEGGRVFAGEREVEGGYDLTPEIDAAVAPLLSAEG